MTLVSTKKFMMASSNTGYLYKIGIWRLSKVKYGDFVVWSKNEVIVESIELDHPFYEKEMDNAHLFLCILCYRRWLARQLIADEDGVVQIPNSETAECVTEEDPEATCGKPSYGEMIA